MAPQESEALTAMEFTMNRRMTRTAASLVIPITIAVSTAFGVSAYGFSRHHFSKLLDSARETAMVQGEVMLEALNHQMMEKNRDLIREMVGRYGRREAVAGLDILDHEGAVWYSSRPGSVGTVLSMDSRTCRSCHLLPPGERETSKVVQTNDRSILRVVVPVENRVECQACHDSSQRLNGLLILDSDVGSMRAEMDGDLRWMVAGSGLLAFLLSGTVAVLIQRLLLRRLNRFELAAQAIANGDLESRVPVSGSDTISWLGAQFNAMADSVTSLFREVGAERERMEAIINSVDDGIVVLDPRRKIMAANNAYLARTGGARRDVLGQDCTVISGDSCQGADCPALTCLATGEYQSSTCSRNDENGKLVWEEVHASPVRGASDQVEFVVEVWRDISERRTAEARLAEAHRLTSLGMLASGFSHEMATPLTTVMTCLEGIVRRAEAAGEGSDHCRAVTKSADIAKDQILRAKGITEHFLRLSRGQKSPVGAVEIKAVVEGAVQLVEPTARQQRVRLEMVLPEIPVVVRGNGADLEHAVVNLLLNSIEASDPEAKVTVGVEVDSEVHVRVSDNGPGISEHDLERIFEPFVSLREGGTGLGLFLTKSFARQWGGRVEVESEPGKGARFEIILPSPSRTVSEEQSS
jgi:PAS domain S-box-containing protein